MAYGKRKRSSSYPGSRKKGRSSRRAPLRRRRGGYRRKRSSRYNPVISTRVLTTPGRSMNMRGLGLPPKMVVHLAYRAFDTVTTTSGGIAGYKVWRLNSLFDPYESGVGQQPRYYDQLCTSTLYRKYRVYRTDVIATVRNRSTDDVQAFCEVSSLAGPSSTAAGQTLFYMGELPYHATRMLNGTGEGGDKARTTFKFTFYPHKYLGITKAQYYAEENYAALFNANPTITPYFVLGASDDPNQTTSGLSADLELTFVYHAVLNDLQNNVAQS